MLAKLSEGYYMYCGAARRDILVTDCVAAWSCSSSVSSEVRQWVLQGRPYTGYVLQEAETDLIFQIDSLPEVILHPADPTKILPIIFTELSLKEKKRELNSKQEAVKRAKEKKRKDLFEAAVLKNVALKVAYLGWKYNGLARQINTRDTIEEILLQGCEKCCLIFTARDYKITRCGRTDKGVSAFSQVISLYLRSKSQGGVEEVELEYDYIMMINNVLPPHIRVLGWSYVGLEFDSRFQVLYRSYKYYFPKCDLDITVMRGASEKFLGTHNYRGFCKSDRTQQNPNYNRTISYLAIDLVNEDTTNDSLSVYSITVLGHAFLWHQIRNMISVLFRVGLGLESPKVISAILKSGVKYNYAMASEVPLVLFDCEFENLQWNTSPIDLSTLYFKSAVKTTLIKQLMCPENVRVKDIEMLCDTKKQSIMSRPFIT